MLEQILDLVKQQGQQFVVQNPEVPDSENNAVMMEAANTITGGFQNILSGGGLQSIISMFTGGGQGPDSNGGNGMRSNPMVSMMIGHLANNLVKKMNLNPAVANSIANNIIPGVLSSLVSKTRSNDPADNGFDLNNLVASLTGSPAAPDNTQINGFDFQGLIGRLGADTNGDGKVDLSDIVNVVTGQAQNQQQEQQKSGGLADLIKGFFR
ncbi:hypothetical protein [Niabella aquatica]